MSGETGIHPAHKAAVEHFQLLRGSIVGAYAQVEFLMADTIVRAQSVPEYDHLPKTPTFNITKRVKRFRELIESPGPINADYAALLNVVRAWEKSENLRHFLVHGFATFRWTRAGDMVMTFRRYMPDLDADDPFREMHFRLATLQKFRDEVSTDVTVALNVFEAMHRRLGWVGPADVPMRGNGV